jgi:hypothetical protein
MNDLRLTQLVPVERVERLIHLVRGDTYSSILVQDH